MFTGQTVFVGIGKAKFAIFFSILRKVSDRIVSIVLNINNKRNNLVLTEENVILWRCV